MKRQYFEPIFELCLDYVDNFIVMSGDNWADDPWSSGFED